MTRLEIPTTLTQDHNLSKFDSGESDIDEWFRNRALKNMAIDATRVYVVCSGKGNVPVGFYGLSATSIISRDVLGSMRRNMPDPIPCLLLGRLGVDKTWQGRGLGKELLADCIMRALKISDIGAARLLLTHPLNDKARVFYLRYDFKELPTEDGTLAIDLNKLRKILPS